MKQINPEWKDLKKGDKIVVINASGMYEENDTFEFDKKRPHGASLNGVYNVGLINEKEYNQIFQPKCPSLEFEGELDDKIKEIESAATFTEGDDIFDAASKVTESVLSEVQKTRKQEQRKEQRKRDLIDLAKSAPPMPNGYLDKKTKEMEGFFKSVRSCDADEMKKISRDYEKTVRTIHENALKRWPVHYAKSVLQGIEADSDEMREAKGNAREIIAEIEGGQDMNIIFGLAAQIVGDEEYLKSKSK